MTVILGRVFAGTWQEAKEKIEVLHPKAGRIVVEPVMELRHGIWWEYHAVFEEGAA